MRAERKRKTLSRVAIATCLVSLFVCSLLSPPVAAQSKKNKWCDDPPVNLDFDMENIPQPKERNRSYYYDFLYSTFGLQIKEGFDLPRNFRKLGRSPKEAYNVNCMSEVPDSSWYTNRNPKRRMSLEEIRTGPNQRTGPAPGAWKVIEGKTEGITPGFLIRDSRGDIYGLKFDPPEYPEMASAAEVIASKLYYAAGYNVKEYYIVVFGRERLVLDPKGKTRDRFGRPRPLREEDIDAIFSKVPRLPDGRYRAVAGKYVDGIPAGPFSFEGVRKDDPNDWIPHEHRRDLRGLRIFCSWVNENDFREGNTLDFYMEEGGRRFLRHYIIDLGSSLGSDTVHANIDRIGHEYVLDSGEITKSLFSLGLYRRPWKGSREVVYPAVGFFESEIFHPGGWKANYPVLPFENMTLQDAFWGARMVLSFTDEQIRAAVETGEFSDPEAASFLAGVLIRRRDKIATYWLSRVNPVDGFAIEEDQGGRPKLAFQDLEVKHALLTLVERSYEYSIRDEQTGKVVLARQNAAASPLDLGLMALPAVGSSNPQASSASGSEERIYRLAVRTLRNGKRQGDAIHIYLRHRNETGKLEITGIDRNPD